MTRNVTYLHGYIDLPGDLSDDGRSLGCCGIPLVGIEFNNNAFVKYRAVLLFMLFPIITLIRKYLILYTNTYMYRYMHSS